MCYAILKSNQLKQPPWKTQILQDCRNFSIFQIFDPPHSNFDISLVFPDKQCLTSVDGAAYKGTRSETWNGTSCAPWSQVSRYVPLNPFHFPENAVPDASQCRNVGGRSPRPWCYTDVRGTTWDFCDIRYCGKLKINNLLIFFRSYRSVDVHSLFICRLIGAEVKYIMTWYITDSSSLDI